MICDPLPTTASPLERRRHFSLNDVNDGASSALLLTPGSFRHSGALASMREAQSMQANPESITPVLVGKHWRSILHNHRGYGYRVHATCHASHDRMARPGMTE
jgi:hypothetical protein